MGNLCEETLFASEHSMLPADYVMGLEGFDKCYHKTLLSGWDGKDYIGLASIMKEEEDIVRFTHRCHKHPLDPRVEGLISQYEADNKITLDGEQRNAVKMFCCEHFGILTGGPGTGKTSVLKCALYCIEQIFQDKDILLCAPTGKAARRMTEATGKYATTVLGAMQFNPATRVANKVLWQDFVFIDEASMIDNTTMTLIARNCLPHTRIFLIGDNEQLPPVGKGAVLRDLLTFDIVPNTRLIKTFRQKEGSTLLTNIKIVKDGYQRKFVDGNDFMTFEELDGFLPLYYSEVKKRGLENVILLTPTRKEGRFCSEALNRIIQKTLNQNNEGVRGRVNRDDRDLVIPFRIGDPVMQLVNTTTVSNGEIGTVIDINPVVVQFNNCTKVYKGRDLHMLDLAYAISIHKSQGSEYECVFVICSDEGNLDRNMIYTAITRAKKQCYVFGRNSIIKEACKKQTSMERITWLSRFTHTKK